MKRIGIYAGTFDPPTLGHAWMIERAASLFDEIIVAIGINPDKKTLFSVDDRLDMLRALTERFPNVRTTSFGNHYLVHYTISTGAQFVLRGIRNGSDYEFERTMLNINGDLDPRVTTVFLMPPREIAEVSSSVVKGLIGPSRWEETVTKYVPQAVLNKLIALTHPLWRNLQTLGATGDEKAFWEEIISPYRDPVRGYHTLSHICAMLAEFGEIKHLLQDPIAVEMAIWFHDIVYDPKAHNNEEQSAERAHAMLLELGLPRAFGLDFDAHVRDLILATKHVSSSEDPDARFLMDLDLAILGKPEDEFDRYERGVRKEYEWVPQDIFARERAKILQMFLDRPSIYSTSFFQERYEAVARENLKRSIERLRDI